MNLVKFHFIVNGKIMTKNVLIGRGNAYFSIPKELVYTYIEDSYGNVRVIFAINGRTKVEKVTDIIGHRVVSLRGDNWNLRIDCDSKVQILFPSMYVFSRMLRLIKKYQKEDITEICEKINEYATEKKVKKYK